MLLNICHTEDTRNEGGREANIVIHKLMLKSSTCTTRGFGTSNMVWFITLSAGPNKNINSSMNMQ